MKRLSRFQGLLVAGLLLVLAGSFLPIRFPIWSSQSTLEMGLAPQDNIDIPVSIPHGWSLWINVIFDDSAVPEDCWVWTQVDYRYPTKYIGETAIRLEGQREVSFTFGWENVRLIPIFVTGFMVRLFYLGSETVTVNVTISSLATVATVVGLGLILVSVLVTIAPVMMNMFGGWRTKEQLMK